MRLISELEMSGNVTGINNMDCSSRGGINSVPKLISKGTLTANADRLTAMVVFLHFIQVRIMGSYNFSNRRVRRFAASFLNLPRIKMESITGASVITKSASTINMNVFV